jgi:hypothetical protein
MLRLAVPFLLLSCGAFAHAACPAAERGGAAVKAAALAYDADAISQLFDADALAERVARGMSDDAEAQAGIRRGIEANRAQLGSGLFASLKASGMQLADQPAPAGRIVLRKETATLTGGVDYLDFALSDDGCIADVESVMLGSSTSSVMRQMLVATLGDGNALTRVLGIASSERVSTETLQQLSAQRADEAVAALQQLVDLVPERDEAHYLLIGVAAQLGRHADTLAAMDRASAALNVEFPHDSLAAEPIYAGLLESPEYARWRKAQD